MLHSPPPLETSLPHRRGLFTTGTIVHLPLGSCLSSHKDGAELRGGDVVSLRDTYSGLHLRNTVLC